MARSRTVTHPKKGFEGRVAGVNFVDGVAEVTGKAQAFWFQTHGYKVTDGRDSKASKPKDVKPPAAGTGGADAAPKGPAT